MAGSTRRTKTASKTPAKAKSTSKPRPRKVSQADWSVVIAADKGLILAIASIGFCLGIIVAITLSHLPVPFVGPYAHLAGEVCTLALEVDSPHRSAEALAMADAIEAFRGRIDRGEFSDLDALLPALRAANRGAMSSDAAEHWVAFSAAVGRLLAECHEKQHLRTPQDAAAALAAVCEGLRDAARS